MPDSMTQYDIFLCVCKNGLAKLHAITEHINKVFFRDFLFKFKITLTIYTVNGHQNGI